MAFSSGSFYQSRDRLHQGNCNVVYAMQRVLRMEVERFPFVGQWKLYVFLYSLHGLVIESLGLQRARGRVFFGQ